MDRGGRTARLADPPCADPRDRPSFRLFRRRHARAGRDGVSAALLRLERVACIRGDRLLFEGLSLTLARGEALWLRGPNGAGKSSLIRLAAGLLHPRSEEHTSQHQAPMRISYA